LIINNAQISTGLQHYSRSLYEKSLRRDILISILYSPFRLILISTSAITRNNNTSSNRNEMYFYAALNRLITIFTCQRWRTLGRKHVKFRLQWRHQHFKPGGAPRTYMPTKSGRNYVHFYANI